MKEKARKLWRDGHSPVAIAKMTGAPIRLVYEWSRAWRREDTDQRRRA